MEYFKVRKIESDKFIVIECGDKKVVHIYKTDKGFDVDVYRSKDDSLCDIMTVDENI